MKILDMMREEGAVRVTHLSRMFDVSEVTIRQDLERLASNDGPVVREHGGAYLKTIPDQVRSLSLQHMENIDRKAAIGRKAVEFVKEGQTIILDAGSTTTEIARNLVNIGSLTVITSALNIALILGTQPGVSLMVTGGEFKAPTLSLTGDKAASFFENIHVDTLFLATAGVDIEAGLTYPGLADLPVKRAMINAAGTVYLAADSTKIGKRSFVKLCEIAMIHAIITDRGIDDSVKAGFEKRGVKVFTG